MFFSDVCSAGFKTHFTSKCVLKQVKHIQQRVENEALGQDCCCHWARKGGFYINAWRTDVKAAIWLHLSVVRLPVIFPLRSLLSVLPSVHRSRVCATEQSWDARAPLLSSSLHIVFCSCEPWTTSLFLCRAKESVQPPISSRRVS